MSCFMLLFISIFIFFNYLFSKLSNDDNVASDNPLLNLFINVLFGYTRQKVYSLCRIETAKVQNIFRTIILLTK